MIVLNTTKTKRITVRLCDQDYNYLTLKSSHEGLPISYIIRQMIRKDRDVFEEEFDSSEQD